MAFAGRVALVLALAVSLYGIAAALYGARHGRRDWVDSGRRSVYCLAAILTVAMAILEVAFIRNDFAYNTVANTSSTTTPLLYRMAAMWSSQEGSLLLWVWLLSIWASVALTSSVCVLVMVCTGIGAAPPTTTPPTLTGMVARRVMVLIGVS